MRILIADDDPIHRKVLYSRLVKWGHEVTVANDGNEAWAILQREEAPCLAILDWRMPGMDGLEVCRAVRQLDKPYVFIMLLTASDQREDLLAGLQAGVDDYLTKPLDAQLLRAHLTTGERVLNLQSRLIADAEALRFKAQHDPLTGLLNRSAILQAFSSELCRAKRQGTSVGIIMADVDHFKQINDTYGHLTGDRALREVARRMTRCCRVYDSIGRYGGEEFLLVLPNVDTPRSLLHAERIRASICTRPMETSPQPIPVTLSLGVASTEQFETDEVETLLHAADSALYRAKKEGRNRVEVAVLSDILAGDTSLKMTQEIHS